MSFKDLEGDAIIKMYISPDKEVLYFMTIKGKKYKMSHAQDCCENVRLIDVIGDWDDILDKLIVVAEERTNRDDPMDVEMYDSFTWTFYELQTPRGSLTMRWLGESNGYYSEGVDFEEIDTWPIH